MQAEWIAELEEIVARFRMGEAEVGRAFFERPRPLDQHSRWLKFQITREARNLREISGDYLKKMVDRTDDTVAREELVDRVKEDYQELRHYAMLAYLYEGLTGDTLKWQRLVVGAQEADWFEFGKREQERRRELAELSQVHKAAGAFTSGGGGALFYGFIGLTGGDYEELLSDAAKIVLHDEQEHGASEGRDLLYPLVQSEEDFRVAAEVITEISALRLRIRNQQFGHVLSEERIEAITRGDIQPATQTMLVDASADIVEDHDWFGRFHGSSKPLSNASVAGAGRAPRP
jgi:hypothetical protein